MSDLVFFWNFYIIKCRIIDTCNVLHALMNSLEETFSLQLIDCICSCPAGAQCVSIPAQVNAGFSIELKNILRYSQRNITTSFMLDWIQHSSDAVCSRCMMRWCWFQSTPRPRRCCWAGPRGQQPGFTPRWPQITVLSQAGKKLQLAVATLETLHTGKVVG